MQKNEILKVIVILLISLSGCLEIDKSEEESDRVSREYSVQALMWQQNSAEHHALCHQAYNLASDRLKSILAEKGHESNKPFAIVSDLDETVIDNSYYNVRLLKSNEDYNRETWKQWVKEEKASAIPGSVSFFNDVSSLGIEIFYISNRKDSEKANTIENLKKLGLPFADSSHVLLKTSTSGKQSRRDSVISNFEVLLYLGDNLSDFHEVFDDKIMGQRKILMDSLKDEFGRRFIMFPNAIYGDWESKGVYGSNYELSEAEKDSIRKSSLKSN